MQPHSRSVRIVLVSTLLLAGVVTAVRQIQAHGSMRVPLSREYNCFLEGPENPQSEACRAAIAEAGTQQFYDWNGINRMDANDRHREIIPDGELCSGGKESHRGLNLARNDWVIQVVAPRADGTFEFVYEASVPHSTRYFEFYVTKDGYDPTVPLKWADLEDEPFCTITQVELENGQYRMSCPMPLEKTGNHLIYNIWQRNDSPEAFYSCMDVTFDYRNVVATPTALPPTNTPQPTSDPSAWSCRVDYTISADWGAGFNAEVTVTNLRDTAIDGWTLSWDFSGEQIVTEVWDGALQQDGQSVAVQNAAWNGVVGPGATVDFGFSASYRGRNELPGDFALNGQPCNGQTAPSPTDTPTQMPPASPTPVNPPPTPGGEPSPATPPVPTPTPAPPDYVPACGAPRQRAILANGGSLLYLPTINRDAAGGSRSGPTDQPAIICTVNYRITAAWETGYIGEMTVSNQGSQDIHGYALRWSFADGEVLEYGWDAVFDQAGTTVTACNSDEHWNGIIGANGGSLATFGFVGQHAGRTSLPSSFTLNGVACTIVAADTAPLRE